MSEQPQEQEIELQIAEAPSISPAVARLSFKFIMPGLVARLYLYLFGEFEKEIIEAALERITEKRTVMDDILGKKKTPLRAVYDFLIAEEFFEDQKLSEDAMLFIDMPDGLQMRIKDPEPVGEAAAFERDFSCTFINPSDSESSECQ